MLKLIPIELRKLKFGILFMFLFSIAYGIVSVQLSISGGGYGYNIEIWDQAMELLPIILGIISVVPVCWLVYYERSDRYMVNVMNRTPFRQYLMVKWLIVSVIGGLTIFLASFIGLVYALYGLPTVVPSEYYQPYPVFMEEMFRGSPFLYGLLLSLWRGFIAFLVTTLGFIFSLFLNNIFLVLTIPFIYVEAENFILSILNFPEFRLVTSFNPTVLTADTISFGSMLGGPVLLVCMNIVVFMLFVYRKQEHVTKL
jgi:hypothetical protein